MDCYLCYHRQRSASTNATNANVNETHKAEEYYAGTQKSLTKQNNYDTGTGAQKSEKIRREMNNRRRHTRTNGKPKVPQTECITNRKYHKPKVSQTEGITKCRYHNLMILHIVLNVVSNSGK
nr:MAG: hypothetical protein AmFV_00021 [Apis mellifera filamentous virus]